MRCCKNKREGRCINAQGPIVQRESRGLPAINAGFEEGCRTVWMASSAAAPFCYGSAERDHSEWNHFPGPRAKARDLWIAIALIRQDLHRRFARDPRRLFALGNGFGLPHQVANECKAITASQCDEHYNRSQCMSRRENDYHRAIAKRIVRMIEPKVRFAVELLKQRPDSRLLPPLR
jgi:hypothetical protein